MSSKEYLTDVSTRHQVFLQRYAGSQSKQAVKSLNRLRRDITARLAQEPTVFQRQRLEAVLQDIDELSATAFRTIGRDTIFGAQELAKTEADFSVKLFNKGTNIEFGFTLPSDAALVAAVMDSSMKVNTNSAITIEDALRQFGTKKSAQIGQVIADGVTLGDTTPVISQKLGTMINTLQRRQLDTLVRTVTNHASSIAKQQVYVANSELLDGYRWIATLDSNTTFICGSRDQQVYQAPFGPMPPAHWGCRSTTIPEVKPEYDIGSELKGGRPSIGPDGAKVISGRTSYGGWLKKQPSAFVDEALGVERSRLFRAGKISIDGFVDPTGRVYTLEQLASLNPIAFME